MMGISSKETVNRCLTGGPWETGLSLLQAALTPTPGSSSVGKVFIHESLDSIPNCYKLGVVVHTCHPRTWEVDVGMLKAGGYPCLYNMFEDSLGFMRKVSQKTKQTNKKTLLSL